jgi:4-amino-4-deoxy-L-arabinose transferase-like glycosyltransferase
LASLPAGAVLESVDAQGYERLGRNLKDGHGFTLDVDPQRGADGLRTPLYPLFIAATYSLVGEQPVVVAAAQSIIDSVAAVIVCFIAAALLGKRAGVIAGLLYAFTPVQWRHSAALLPEVPLAFFFALSIWLLVRLVLNEAAPPHWRLGAVRPSVPVGARNDRSGPLWVAPSAIICGLAAGLAALTKPNLAGLALILGGAAFFSLRARRHKAVTVAATIIVTAVFVVSPWTIRNWTVFGRPFLSNAALGFVARVAAPATLGVVEGHQVPVWSPEWEARYHDIVTQASERYGWPVGAAAPAPPLADQRERQIAEVASQIVRAHPFEALRAHIIGFVRSWAPLEQTFWYMHLTDEVWEDTGFSANSFRDAVEILLAGRPIEAFGLAFVEPWGRLDGLARALWYSWGLSHVFGLVLMGFGVLRLRRRPVLALMLVAVILYATLPPGPIGYVRFRVPVVSVIVTLQVAGLLLLTSKLSSLRALWPRGIFGG